MFALPLSCLLLLLLPLLSPLAAAQRSVLFLVHDDGGLALSPYGDPTISTPALAALAARGTVFDAASTTVSSCSPSRASILSGLPTHQSGAYGLSHAGEHQAAFAGLRSLPNVLNDAGVATGVLGKYHVWSGPSMAAATQSFNFTWGLSPTGPGGCQAGAAFSCPDTDYNTVSRNISYMRAEFDSFLAWAGAAPFFFYIGFGDSHRCGGVQGEFCERWGRGGAIPDWHPIDYDPASVALPFWVQDTPVARADFAHMLTAVNRLDQGVGLILDRLERSGRANETLVVYVSDNGAPFAAGKTNLYEPGARVPLIISAPGAAGAGGRSSALASTLDLLPTVLDWMGVPLPAYPLNGQTARPLGKSLLPILQQQAAAAAVPAEAAAAPPLLPPRAPAPPPVLPANYSVARGSFQMHEIQEYYPMRSLLVSDPLPAAAAAAALPGAAAAAAAATPSFLIKLIMNIAGPYLPYPIASDLWSSPSMQDLVNRTRAGVPTNWYRNFSSYVGVPRPRYELYDLLSDPAELTNLAAEPAWAAVLATLQADIKAWQEATGDGWLIKYSHE